ncbi:hypothetical protein MPSEU_000441900 [Mayamaea pseudoterrestris]|nr:hypothetical protein MPSEU_000441900 [Mayamaea pseudoterrestris]
MLLLELREIVEQIDYARAFAALKGVAFLLGCIQEPKVPVSTRAECCGIIATMAQHNPPVQKEMLEAGALKTLSDLFFTNDQEDAFQARLIQAMSAIVRQNNLAETVFCKLEQSVPLFESALRKGGSPVVQKRAMFFLSALLTSDESDSQRTSRFASVLALVEAEYMATFVSPDTRELSLSLMLQLIERDLIFVDKRRNNDLAALGVDRIHALRSMDCDEALHTHAAIELELWEQLLSLLAKLA